MDDQPLHRSDTEMTEPIMNDEDYQELREMANYEGGLRYDNSYNFEQWYYACGP